ncbi:hypothetical protein E2C01_059313 [Portunus trituberculatus]|uniref:Uncharacterized protein n=1 Tax=Portunus trituberculatus TaxID=210409 RepID=A0A5B7GYS9_PORTR|nr:hypothetical protein [Portunus trituberculatus]
MGLKGASAEIRGAAARTGKFWTTRPRVGGCQNVKTGGCEGGRSKEGMSKGARIPGCQAGGDPMVRVGFMDAMKENGIFRAVCFGRWRGAQRRAVTPGVVLLLTQATYPSPSLPSYPILASTTLSCRTYAWQAEGQMSRGSKLERRFKHKHTRPPEPEQYDDEPAPA